MFCYILSYMAHNPLKSDTECLLNIWQSSYLTQQTRETHDFLLIKQRVYTAKGWLEGKSE